MRPRFHSGLHAFAVLLASTLFAFGTPANAQQVFRVTAIPDESPTELARKAAPLMKCLESQLGVKVEYMPVTDDAPAVEAQVNGKVGPPASRSHGNGRLAAAGSSRI